MTLVNAETGEIAECTADEARAITDRIKVAADATWHLIAEAYTKGAHMVLGYVSWDDYCTREFGTSRLRLPREDRQEVVGSLRDAGLSVRAIAAATGESKSSISRSLPPVPNGTPARPALVRVEVTPNFKGSAPTVKGRDGKSYPMAPSKADQRAEAVEKYPWLDDMASDAVIISTAGGLDGYTGAELEKRIEASKRHVASEVRERNAPPDPRPARIAMLNAALDLLVKFNVAAGRAECVLKDDPSLIDADDTAWIAAIQSARNHLDDLTPLPRTLKVVK